MHRFSIAPRESLARTAVASSVLAAVFAASLLGPTGLSHAQPKGAVGAGSASVAASAKPVSDANRKEAAERFKRGVQLQSDGNLDAAVIEFERAYELAPAYQVLYNIAVVYRDKSDRASALRAFERFLNEGKDAIDAKRRKDVEGEIAKLREVVAMINIKSSVAGADITLDDQPLGKTPLAQALMVNVGRHKIEATKDGFRGDTQFVTLAGKDNRTVELNLKEIKADTPPPATTTAPPPVTATTSAPPPTTTAKLTTEGNGNKGLGYGLSIAGVLGLGVGTFFGLQARSQWNDAKPLCPNNKCTTDDAQSKAKDAKSNANISTLGFGLGGALLVAGVVLIITSSSSSSTETAQQQKLRVAPSVGNREGGLSLTGAF